jgi:hypothetical protein
MFYEGDKVIVAHTTKKKKKDLHRGQYFSLSITMIWLRHISISNSYKFWFFPQDSKKNNSKNDKN